VLERIVTLVPESGLHSRPAPAFVETVQAFEADVTVGAVDGEQVSAESMLAVTSLGVASGERVRLTAEGPDAEAALDALEAVLSTPEGDGA
jgi:phosphocarrier protein